MGCCLAWRFWGPAAFFRRQRWHRPSKADLPRCLASDKRAKAMSAAQMMKSAKISPL